jgi:outer membrane lipoprotein-sorting protein
MPDSGNRSMKKFALILLMLLLLPLAGYAQSLDEAARQAARQYNAKVLSAHTEQQGNQKVHVIKLITQDGVVKTVRVSVRG